MVYEVEFCESGFNSKVSAECLARGDIVTQYKVGPGLGSPEIYSLGALIRELQSISRGRAGWTHIRTQLKEHIPKPAIFVV